jgi:hypothetical protein
MCVSFPFEREGCTRRSTDCRPQRRPDTGAGRTLRRHVHVERQRVDGADITNLSLVTSAGWSVSGVVVTENGTAHDSPRRDQFRFAARPIDSDATPGPPMTGFV